jgi:hypothetical protein
MELDFMSAAGFGAAAVAGAALCYVLLRPGQTPKGVFSGLTVSDVPPGTMKEAKLEGGKVVLIVNDAGQGFKATGAKCT